MDGILVELCIHELDLQSCDLLCCERSSHHSLFEGLLDEFHRLVEVLDTFGAVEEDVVVLETDDSLCLFSIHSQLCELVCQCLRVLDLRIRIDVSSVDGLFDALLER